MRIRKSSDLTTIGVSVMGLSSLATADVSPSWSPASASSAVVAVGQVWVWDLSGTAKELAETVSSF